MNIFTQVYGELQANHTKLGKQVFDCLDREVIQAIIVQDNTFWFEYGYQSLPNNVHEWLVKYIERKGYDYLYSEVTA